MITPTREDYIREIYKMQEVSAGEVRLVDLAERLSLSKSTVTERIAELVDVGFAKHEPYSGVDLTKKGRVLGRTLTYKHRIIETFLIRILKINKEDLHEEAHKLEHACSDKVIEGMRKLVPDATHCPDGNPIPFIRKNKNKRTET